jgi:hypothetical protein
LIEQTPKKNLRSRYENRLSALKKSAQKAKTAQQSSPRNQPQPNAYDYDY